MGNVVAFGRRADVIPLDRARDRRLTSQEIKDLPTASEVEFPQSADAASSHCQTSSGVFKRFSPTRFARGSAKPSKHPDQDAYLLVLLADQERTAGRDAEALSLLEAAYAAFDHRTDRQHGCMASG